MDKIDKIGLKEFLKLTVTHPETVSSLIEEKDGTLVCHLPFSKKAYVITNPAHIKHILIT